MSFDANTVVVGSAQRISPARNGVVTVYKWNGSTWNSLGARIESQENLDGWGDSVTINSLGTVICGGAPNQSYLGNTNVGACRIYTLISNAWVQRGASVYGSAAGKRFGTSVDMDDIGDMFISVEPNTPVQIPGSNGQNRAIRWGGSSWQAMGDAFDTGNLGAEDAVSVYSTPNQEYCIAINLSNINGRVLVYEWVPE
jgi:hypothetical protein